MIEIYGKYGKALVYSDSLEPECYTQISNMMNHPAFTEQVRIMPDVHLGKGSVIGFTMPLSTKIDPQVVGVDIGCGMLSQRVSLAENILKHIDWRKEFDQRVRGVIPMGMNIHSSGNSRIISEIQRRTINKAEVAYRNPKYLTYTPPSYSDAWVKDIIKRVGIKPETFYNSIGTLGGGNHFIELGYEEDNPEYGWITIHSGSRNFGLRVCDYWVNQMKFFHKDEFNLRVSELKRDYTGVALGQKIEQLRQSFSPKSYLEGDGMTGYLYDMIFAQSYAEVNREEILRHILKVFPGKAIDTPICSVHNYVNFSDGIIRKGAISAYQTERVIIPWNMRDGLIIGVGKSNPDWNFSAPHGAGRTMSRKKAKDTINADVVARQMEDVYSSCIPIDEAPDAFKPVAEVMKYLEESVEVQIVVKPLVNLKADESPNERRGKKK